jgi:hypothetical protein
MDVIRVDGHLHIVYAIESIGARTELLADFLTRRLVVGDDTRIDEALIAAGWTPPQ